METIATYNTLPTLNKEGIEKLENHLENEGLPITSRKPAENETVWFWVDDEKLHIQCMVYNRRGWHLGWWSGSRWHSYFDSVLKKDDSKVKCWMPLRLPELAKE